MAKERSFGSYERTSNDSTSAPVQVPKVSGQTIDHNSHTLQTMFNKAINVGKTETWPFTMAFLFTQHGTKIYVGSVDKISDRTKHDPVCHAIVHVYSYQENMAKHWQLFGRNMGLRLFRTSADKSEGTPLAVKHKKNILIDKNQKVIGAWRRLPSKFLRELRPYQ